MFPRWVSASWSDSSMSSRKLRQAGCGRKPCEMTRPRSKRSSAKPSSPSGRIDAFTAILGEELWDSAAVDKRERAYARFRITRDSIMLRKIVQDPEAWQLSSVITSRRRWELGDPRERRAWCQAFDQRLAHQLNSYSADSEPLEKIAPVTRDWVALDTAAAWLLACVQWLESVVRQTATPTNDDPSKPGVPLPRDVLKGVRETCYSSRAEAAAPIARRVRATLGVMRDPSAAEGAADRWIESRKPAEARALDAAWDSLDDAFAKLQTVLTGWETAVAAGRSGEGEGVVGRGALAMSGRPCRGGFAGADHARHRSALRDHRNSFGAGRTAVLLGGRTMAVGGSARIVATGTRAPSNRVCEPGRSDRAG